MGLLEYLQNVAKGFEAKVTNFTESWWDEIFPRSPEPLENIVDTNTDTDFDELLEEEAPAAGAQGGLGHNFTRNDRIVEEVNPPGFEFPGTARDVGEIELGKAQGDEDEEADPFADTIPREEEDNNTPTPPTIPDEPITDDEPPVEPDEDDDTTDPEVPPDEDDNPPEPPIDDEDDDEDDEDQDDEPDDDEDDEDDEDDDPDDDNENDEDDEEDDEDDDDDDDEDEDPDDEDPDDEEDDDDDDEEDDDPPDDDDELTGQNPGNDKEVGNSQWDGETGASGKEGKGKHQDGIDTDENQPGGKEKGQNLTEDDLLYDDSKEIINNNTNDMDYSVLLDNNHSNQNVQEHNPTYDF